ncbi:MAG: DUF4405 domain-containing protein [Anaerolineales bacterium]|nr:DUF4405 domain-containing protein [Anaerolineales bacterium]
MKFEKVLNIFQTYFHYHHPSIENEVEIMVERKKKTSPVKINYLIDFIIFVAFLAAMDPHMTGIAIHEWLSIAFGAAIITHLLLHWRWLAATTRRIFSKVARQARVNYILNTLFFIDMTLVIFTGIMISEEALPLLGIRLEPGFIWRTLHSLSSDAALFLLGLHVALHWKWIVSTTKRYVLKPMISIRLGKVRQEVSA